MSCFRVHFPAGWFEIKGDELVKAGNLEEAEAIFKEEEGIAPWSASPHYRLGLLYLERGKLDESILEFEKAIQKSPEDLFAYKSYAELGYIHVQKSQFDKAIEMYQNAIKGMIDDKEDLYQDLGHCYLVQGKYDEAISMYKEALKLNPEFIPPHFYLGNVYLMKKMKDKAMEEYKVYLEHATDAKEIKKIKALITELSRP